MKRAALSARAEQDIVAAVTWYESERVGLGERFLES